MAGHPSFLVIADCEERSRKQSKRIQVLDCHVATLLAMTGGASALVPARLPLFVIADCEERSRKQSRCKQVLDCRVATLLAMTGGASAFPVNMSDKCDGERSGNPALVCT
ncbi:MAG: hypothetical protein LBF05_03515 [Tannerella sp.]|nr:hypothetical protein [Tannerella sp.]